MANQQIELQRFESLKSLKSIKIVGIMAILVCDVHCQMFDQSDLCGYYAIQKDT